jgi:Skp family chaperone for outer membrane proteins
MQRLKELHMTMTKIARFALPALLGAALFAGSASAQGATSIGVVDTEQVLENSLAGKAVKLEREKYGTAYTNQVKDTEAKLRTEDQELSQQRGVLAPDVFQQKATAFQQKIQDFQNTVRDKQERLEFASNQAMQEIANTMLVVSQEVAKEKGLNAVLPRGAVLVFEPGMDITKSVLDKLNARLPSVQFQNPDTLQRSDGQAAAGAPASAKPAAAPAKGKK